MRQHIIKGEDVVPGTITFDDLVFDPEASLVSQLDDLKDDLLLVQFPNGCVLAVSWLPAFDADGQFIVDLWQGDEGDRIDRRFSVTFQQMRRDVIEVANIARERPAVAYTIFEPGEFYPGHIVTNKLVLNPERALSAQTEALFAAMLRVYFRDDDTEMRVDWLPEHSPEGEFHVTLTRWELADPPDPTVHFHRTCRTIPELREIISEVVKSKASTT